MAEPRNQQGVALLLALVLAAVLTAMGALVTLNARSQLRTTELLGAQDQAWLAAHSGTAEVVFTMLTQGWHPQRIAVPGATGKQWNTYGEPFALTPQLTLRIQDESGLLPLNSPGYGLVQRWLQLQGQGLAGAGTAVDSLLDWVDEDDNPRALGAEQLWYVAQGRPGPRNGALQAVEELVLVRGFETVELDTLRRLGSLAVHGQFNPLAAPVPLLPTVLGRDLLARFIDLRASDQLTAASLPSLLGSRMGPGWSALAGDFMRVTVEAAVGEARVQRRFRLHRQPENLPPFLIEALAF